MNFSQQKINLLPLLSEPKYVVFTDFDETYLAHQNTNEHQKYLRKIEKYLLTETSPKKIFFGWVTGSSLNSVFNKINKCGLKLLPHFIASSLGTEITYFNQHQYGEKDRVWQSNLVKSNFSQELVNDLVSQLKLENIHLTPQPEFNHSDFLKNYYYYQQNDVLDVQAILRIKELVGQAGIHVNISYANPLCGDPENCYDVDFTPLGTGKKDIVNFILQQTKVSYENSLAFGESGNDIQMLQTVKHGYLVKNATNEAKQLHSKIADYEYTRGILSVLKILIK